MDIRLTASNLDLFPQSLVHYDDVEYALVGGHDVPKLAVLAETGSSKIQEFAGESSDFKERTLLLGSLNPYNASVLREQLPWLKPSLLGLSTSAGFGDRLGIATPGHVRAVRTTHGKVAPNFAQQSIREMQRTGRTPQQVIDAAMWGVFEEGWQTGFGADADHLKTKEHIDACLKVGFTFFTLDPGDYVDNQVDQISIRQLKRKLQEFPGHLQPKMTGLLGKTFDIDGKRITFDEHVLAVSVLKYGIALNHINDLYQHLLKVSYNHPFELEISMDETDQPTSPAEHIYIASQLHKLGVKWISFAPRFIGRFEKGVDYIGDLSSYESQLASHAAIARQFGPYKLSLHSGSDKFSIYPLFMHETHGLAHLKTCGTSYLEALRTVAAVDPDLLEEIYKFSLENFEADKKSYHISAQINQAPKPNEIKDWPGLLMQFDAREILHVTFGSVLRQKMINGQTHFYDRLIHLLGANRELYFDNLVRHFKRHLEPFSG